MRRLLVTLLLAASPAFAQARKLSDAACRLDGGAGCGGAGGGSGTVTSIDASGGTTGFSFSGGPVTTSGTLTLGGTLGVANGGTGVTTTTAYSPVVTGPTATGAWNVAIGPGAVGQAFMSNGAGVAPSWQTPAVTGSGASGRVAYWSAAGVLTSSSTFTFTGTSLGVGAASPGAALEVAGSMASVPGIIIHDTSTTSGNFGLALNSDLNTDVNYRNWAMVSGSTVAGDFDVRQSTARGGDAITASASRFYIDFDGDIFTGPLASYAGVAASFVATPPAQITTTQAGIAMSVRASDAVAGSSVAGAAAGGTLTLEGGDAARLTSGNANGGGIWADTGAGIGTGTHGDFVVRTGGPTVTNQKVRLAAPTTTSIVMDNGAGSLTGAQTTAIGANLTGSAAVGATILGYGTGPATTCTDATFIGRQAGSAAGSETGGLSAAKGSARNVYLGADASGTAMSGQNESNAIGYRARAHAANATVIGGMLHNLLQIGSNSNTPIARTLRSPASRGGTDTDTAGSDLNVAGGPGTGTAGGGSVRVQTAPPDASGTAANTLSDRRVFAAKPVTLTESTATLVLNVGVASGTVAGGVFSYTIRADDATDFQVIRGDVPWSAVNKGGTITATLGTPIEVTTTSTGTLTNTTTAVVNGNTIDFKLNAVSSLTQTTLYAYVSGTLDGTGVFTTQ